MNLRKSWKVLARLSTRQSLRTCSRTTSSSTSGARRTLMTSSTASALRRRRLSSARSFCTSGGSGSGSGGSDPDFTTQWKTENVDDMKEQVTRDVADNRIFVFMKGTPAMPQCGFSRNVVQILQVIGVEFGTRDVLSHAALRGVIKEFRFD